MTFYARKCLSYSTVGVMYSLICFSYLSKLQFEDSYQTYFSSQRKAVSMGVGGKKHHWVAEDSPFIYKPKFTNQRRAQSGTLHRTRTRFRAPMCACACAHTHGRLLIGRQLVWYGVSSDGAGSRETRHHLLFRQDRSFFHVLPKDNHSTYWIGLLSRSQCENTRTVLHAERGTGEVIKNANLHCSCKGLT